MNKVKESGAMSSASSGGSKTVSGGLSILIALSLPVEANIQVIAAGALPPVIDYILPKKLPWKKGEK